MVNCFNTSVIRKTVMQFADDLYYCIGGKFGRGKAWQIISDSPTKIIEISSYN